jgi:transcriptional regulator with XRE-family HTH domain
LAVSLRRHRFAARRKAVGCSQEQLAERLGIDRSTVGRWESGETEPQPWIRPKLARVLQVSLDQLDGLLGRDSLTDAESDERISYALMNPGRADLLTVAHLRQQVRRLDEQYVSVPSTSLLADTGQCLGRVGFLSAHISDGRVRRELSMVEAEAAILMGQLVWDASQRRDHTSARMYLDQAIAAARQFGDPGLEGLALLRKSMIALYGQQNPKAGLRLALQTAETTSKPSGVLSGLATLHVAEAYAMLGEARSCENALLSAEGILTNLSQTDRAIDLYAPNHFGRMAGSCYLFLSHDKRAQSLLEEAALSFNGPSKPLAIVLGNLALASIRQGNLDEAVARLYQAIEVIERNWGGGGLTIVFGACRELRPWRTTPVVETVYDRLFSLMATT